MVIIPKVRTAVLGAVGIASGTALAAMNDWLASIDRTLVEAASGAPDFLSPVAEAVMIFGSLVGLVAVIPFAYLRFSSFVIVVELFAAGVIARIVSDLSKQAFSTPRPTIEQGINVREVADSFSFPSGHATFAFAIATVWGTRVSSWERIAVFGLATAVAVGRLYVGAHFVVDIVGGAAVGILVGVAVRAVASRIVPSR